MCSICTQCIKTTVLWHWVGILWAVVSAAQLCAFIRVLHVIRCCTQFGFWLCTYEGWVGSSMYYLFLFPQELPRGTRFALDAKRSRSIGLDPNKQPSRRAMSPPAISTRRVCLLKSKSGSELSALNLEQYILSFFFWFSRRPNQCLFSDFGGGIMVRRNFEWNNLASIPQWCTWIFKIIWRSLDILVGGGAGWWC